MKNSGIKISLFLIYFVFAALLNSVGILVERAQEVYGIAKPDAAILEPFKDISIAIMAFVVGSFLPRLGFKKGMLISLAVVFFGCIGMFFGNSFLAVKLLFLCVGLSFAVVKVAVYALIGYITDGKKEHSSLMNLIETVFMIGIIFMYVIFPLFYDDNDPNAWLNGYLLMAGLIAVAFFIIMFSKFDVEPEKSNGVKDDFSKMFALFKKPLIWIFAAFAFLYVMTEQGIMTWLPTFNKDTLKLSPKLGSQMAVLLMVSIALGRFIAGILSKKIKWIYISAISAVLAIVLVLLVLPLAENIEAKEIKSITDLPVVSYLFPLIGLFLAPLYPLINSTVLSSVDKGIHSSLAGILTFFSAVGGTAGSLLIGNLFDSLGGDKVFYLSIIPFGLMFIIFFVINKMTSNSDSEAIAK
ncbi:MFS transporter [Spongiivirga citrea]|uniref:MFS transporter n=1 Tax=Spongiivirga citrea TaxID=1481457 RepID=A0A6M0CMC6_9FLAO|nr:MFS transporter [Spongiivirga citrea]NER18123.1 MFS transporter [Spongiivirga citrea]